MEFQTILAFFFLLPCLIGAILVIIARTKFALDSAPGLLTTAPSFFKKSKTWYKPPGFILHAIGVTLIYSAFFINAVYSLYKLFA